MKLLGAICLMGGAVMICTRWIRHRRRELRLMEEIAVALEHMAALIRLKKEPLLQAVRQQRERVCCGEIFGRLMEYVEQGETFQHSWNRTFCALKPSEMAELLCRTDLTGDEMQITGALCVTAQQLRQMTQRGREGQTQNERLCLTLGLCTAGIITIVLI